MQQTSALHRSEWKNHTG